MSTRKVRCQPPPLGPLLAVEADTKGKGLTAAWPILPPDIRKIMAGKSCHNLGLRLDKYIILDPDNLEAVIFLTRLEKGGQLPITVSWLTPSGRVVRLYRPPHPATFEGKIRTMVAVGPGGIMLEVRAGRHYQNLIPPSKVDGKGYTWACDPWTTAVAILPPRVLRAIQKMAQPLYRLDPLPEKYRERFLVGQGRWKRAWGGEQDEIELHLQKLNRERCNPPLPVRKVSEIAQATARGPRNPNYLKVVIRFEGMDQALAELGDGGWVKRAALVEHFRELKDCSDGAVSMALRRMKTCKVIEHKKGGWYRQKLQ